MLAAAFATRAREIGAAGQTADRHRGPVNGVAAVKPRGQGFKGRFGTTTLRRDRATTTSRYGTTDPRETLRCACRRDWAQRRTCHRPTRPVPSESEREQDLIGPDARHVPSCTA